MDPNQGNPYMQGANPFMQGSGEPPLNGSPNAQTPVSGGVMDAGMAPPGGESATTKPRQMPAGSAPMGMGAGPMGAGEQPVSSVAPLGGTSGPNTPQTPPPQPSGGSNTTALLRQVRAEIKRDNPDVLLADAHVIALAVVDLIQAEAVGHPSDPHNRNRQQQQGPGYGRRTQMGDLNNPSNPNSPLHPAHPQNPRNIGRQQVDEDGDEDEGQWRPQAGGRTPLDDKAYQVGYYGKYPYAAGGAAALVQGFQNWRRQKKSGGMPPGRDHPDSRQIPASS